MKKFACALIALMLCFTAFAAPSRTTSDTTTVDTEATTIVDSEGNVVEGVAISTSDADVSAEVQATSENVVAALSTSDPVEYFANLTSAENNTVELSSIINTSNGVNINEVFNLALTGSQTDIAKVDAITTKVSVATTYKPGTKVAVLVGVTVNGVLQWFALEGEATGNDVEFTIPDFLVEMIGTNGATVAIANDPADEVAA